MRNNLSLFNFIIILSIFIHTYAISEELKSQHLFILTENAGEANYLESDGKAHGHNVEIVNEIMKRNGEIFQIEVLPWARAYYMTEHDPNTALFSTIRTTDRENQFKWVGPLHFLKYILYARKDFQKEINSLEDAKKVDAIGCVGEDIGQKLLINKGFKNIDPYFGVKANFQNLKKLMAGRIDLWFSSPKEVSLVASQLGIDPSKLKETIVVARQHAYVAFSLKTPDHIIEKWQKTLDEMKSDGTYERIMLKYPKGKDSITFDKPGPARDE